MKKYIINYQFLNNKYTCEFKGNEKELNEKIKDLSKYYKVNYSIEKRGKNNIYTFYCWD